ncbi:beta-lactamase-like 1 [Paraphaeosphaeria sporulosa]
MPPTYGILLLTLFSITAVMHAALCPIYGPVFPPAKGLVDSPASRDAVTHIDAALDDALASGKSIHGPVSFDETVSIQIFDKEGAVFEHYNEGVDVAGGESDGREVNGGPVYRVGSVSKLYAVYLLLVVAGDHVFSDPAVKYLPEWEGVAYWDDVSGGALAGQIGVVADLYDVDSIAGGGLGAQFPRAFPELSEDENSPSSSSNHPLGTGGKSGANYPFVTAGKSNSKHASATPFISYTTLPANFSQVTVSVTATVTSYSTPRQSPSPSNAGHSGAPSSPGNPIDSPIPAGWIPLSVSTTVLTSSIVETVVMVPTKAT